MDQPDGRPRPRGFGEAAKRTRRSRMTSHGFKKCKMSKIISYGKIIVDVVEDVLAEACISWKSFFGVQMQVMYTLIDSIQLSLLPRRARPTEIRYRRSNDNNYVQGLPVLVLVAFTTTSSGPFNIVHCVFVSSLVQWLTLFPANLCQCQATKSQNEKTNLRLIGTPDGLPKADQNSSSSSTRQRAWTRTRFDQNISAESNIHQIGNVLDLICLRHFQCSVVSARD